MMAAGDVRRAHVRVLGPLVAVLVALALAGDASAQTKCASTVNPCGNSIDHQLQADCVDTSLNYKCVCKTAGRVYVPASRTCVECLLGICKGNSLCVNSPANSYTCTCPTGYAYNHTRGGCFDVNECLTNNPCKGNSVCVDAPVWPICRCPNGYFYNGTACVDINECNLLPSVCHGGAVCQNLAGSYRCICPTQPSWAYNATAGDCYNPCLHHPCGEGNCTGAPFARTTYKYTCACPTGWLNGPTCTDQCAGNPCGTGNACIRAPTAATPWKYNCSCLGGSTFMNGTCKGSLGTNILTTAHKSSVDCSTAQAGFPCNNSMDGKLDTAWEGAVAFDTEPMIQVAFSTYLKVAKARVVYVAGDPAYLSSTGCAFTLNSWLGGGDSSSAYADFNTTQTHDLSQPAEYIHTFSPALTSVMDFALACYRKEATDKALIRIVEIELYAS
ncbi:hypothetical protein HYH03_001026 [Edaphochlamys debaryana]|uniref:EGF-like domain-containing protein n=1 Tax=Edaphochlamys debaryana TaxID=47281 RepID=A0A835YEH0_9CHLO|nr:hypothetical protein HYH03_001026 [Edaphochlamys debaryana]|eukprot:KAG2501213.1 hypothetical protein HYH03_001026 [Edaphochlamys debaryana]